MCQENAWVVYFVTAGWPCQSDRWGEEAFSNESAIWQLLALLRRDLAVGTFGDCSLSDGHLIRERDCCNVEVLSAARRDPR